MVVIEFLRKYPIVIFLALRITELIFLYYFVIRHNELEEQFHNTRSNYEIARINTILDYKLPKLCFRLLMLLIYLVLIDFIVFEGPRYSIFGLVRLLDFIF